jgi:hypothetical protein
MRHLSSIPARLLLILLAITVSPLANSADADDLTAVLHAFLAGVDTAEAHDRFWAEDLVYTSSSGTRTDKAEIMSGFGDSPDGESDEAGPVYGAEDIRINVYGTTAVVAFRLVANNPDASVQNYLNTGTFLKRNGMWQVVAWQATKITE